MIAGRSSYTRISRFTCLLPGILPYYQGGLDSTVRPGSSQRQSCPCIPSPSTYPSPPLCPAHGPLSGAMHCELSGQQAHRLWPSRQVPDPCNAKGQRASLLPNDIVRFIKPAAADDVSFSSQKRCITSSKSSRSNGAALEGAHPAGFMRHALPWLPIAILNGCNAVRSRFLAFLK